MRTGLVHAMAWCLATGAAVTLSWWGVHTVMAGTAYDPPRALSIDADEVRAPTPTPVSSSTHRAPSPSLSPSKSASPPASSPAAPKPGESAKPSSSTRAATPHKSETTPPPVAAPVPSNVRSYTVDGGRVVLDIGEASAELVSATPDAGWQMQVWTQTTWIRVTFTRDGRDVSVFCTWHDHPPLVEFDDRQS